jgi:hypothetical protein
MKTTAIHFIPIYGMFKYFNEYFKADKRDAKDAIQATWMEMYHFITGLLIALPPIIWLIQKF